MACLTSWSQTKPILELHFYKSKVYSLSLWDQADENSSMTIDFLLSLHTGNLLVIYTIIVQLFPVDP